MRSLLSGSCESPRDRRRRFLGSNFVRYTVDRFPAPRVTVIDAPDLRRGMKPIWPVRRSESSSSSGTFARRNWSTGSWPRPLVVNFAAESHSTSTAGALPTRRWGTRAAYILFEGGEEALGHGRIPGGAVREILGRYDRRAPDGTAAMPSSRENANSLFEEVARMIAPGGYHESL